MKIPRKTLIVTSLLMLKPSNLMLFEKLRPFHLISFISRNRIFEVPQSVPNALKAYLRRIAVLSLDLMDATQSILFYRPIGMQVKRVKEAITILQVASPIIKFVSVNVVNQLPFSRLVNKAVQVDFLPIYSRLNIAAVKSPAIFHNFLIIFEAN